MEEHGRADTDRQALAMARMKAKAASPPWGPWVKSLRSLPAQKASPLPAISTAPISERPEASARAAVMAWYMAAVRAFFLSGRSIWISRTPPSSISSIASLMIVSVA
jgi:hypothetical protein